jgi:hypothetical protein
MYRWREQRKDRVAMSKPIRVLGCLGGLLLVGAVGLAADPHQYIPADTKQIGVVKFRKLLDAPLVDRSKPATLRDVLKKEPHVRDILGIKPLEDVESILIALPCEGEMPKVFIVLQGNFDRARIEESIARNHKDTLKKHKVNGISYCEFKVPVQDVQRVTTPPDVYLAVPDQGTCLISLGNRADLETALGDRKAGIPPELRTLLDKNDKDCQVSYAFLSELRGPFANLPPLRKLYTLVQGGHGYLHVDEDVSGQMTGFTASKEAANEAADICRAGVNTITGLVAFGTSAKRELAPILEVLKTVRVSRKDKEVTIKGKLERDVLEDVLKNIKKRQEEKKGEKKEGEKKDSKPKAPVPGPGLGVGTR